MLYFTMILIALDICPAPHVHTSMAHVLFVRTRHRTVYHTHPVVLKMPLAQSAFPQKGAPPVLLNKPSPSGERESLGRRFPKGQGLPVSVCVTGMPASCNTCQTASADFYRNQYTTDLICVSDNMVDWSVSQPKGTDSKLKDNATLQTSSDLCVLPSWLGLKNTLTASLQRGETPLPTSVLDMTLNNLIVRFEQCWSFGEYGVPLHCHRSQVHSGPEW